MLVAVLVLAAVLTLDGDIKRRDLETLSAFAILALLVVLGCLYERNHWFEVDARELREYRGGRVRRRFPLETIRGVKRSLGGIQFTFASGRVRISPLWTGADAVTDRLSTLVEAGSGSVGSFPSRRDFVRYLCFPARCAACGGRPEAVQEVRAGWTLNLPHLLWHRTVGIAVPVCRACARRRRAATVWSWAVIVIIVGVAFAVVVGDFFPELGRTATPWLAVLALLLILPNWGLNGLRKLLDFRLLGVRGRRYFPSTEEVELRFRDPALELVVQQLSADCRRQALASASEYLRTVSR